LVIVGGGLAGVRTAQGLRDHGYGDPITILSAEGELPYDRPPLSKAFLLGTAADDAIELLAADAFAAARIDLELDAVARALDPDGQTVELEDGRLLAYDTLVVATGARPRRLGGGDHLHGVHYLRSADDARALRLALRGQPRVAVVGGGFIGLEVAAVAATLGASVTVVEAAEAPLNTVLGTDLGSVLRAWHEDHGVAFECGATVRALVGEERVEALELGDGARLEADVVVIGVGVEPNVEWLGRSGIDLHRGVVCDLDGRTSLDAVWAVGDATCRHVGGTCVRSEHWTAANDHAHRAARAIAGAPRREEPVETYFWSDQYDARLQFVGTPTGQVPVIEAGDVAARRFVAVYREDERVTAVFAMNSPREFLQARLALRRELAATDAYT
jgi:3-phenylpropionate/trans-cinnamate dioxygenase ferredoxin reductase subunit